MMMTIMVGVSMKFKPKDFESLQNFGFDDMAEIANAVLEAWLAEAPIVYGLCKTGSIQMFTESAPSNATHKARLVCIEEIEKQPHVHRPYSQTLMFGPNNVIKCECGAEIEQVWEAKK